MSELENRINNILSSPEDMEKIVGMAKSLMDSGALGALGGAVSDNGDGGQRDTGDIAGGLGGFQFDPNMSASIIKIISGMNSNNEKHALLTAMSPYLGDRRREKMARAIQIAKMAKLARTVLSESGGSG